MRLAIRNLLADPGRLLLSIAGVALSIGLILLLAGYRAGVYSQSTSYLDNTPGSVLVVQRGVRNFLGASSVLPRGVEAAVRATPGVARAIPVVSQFVLFERHERKDGFFLIGYDPAFGGGPWTIVGGREPTADDELVVDRTMAAQHGIAIGDRLEVLDRASTVVGLSDGTMFWAGSIAFAPITTLESLLRTPGVRGLLVVSPVDGVAVEELRERLAPHGVDVLDKSTVVANDRQLMARIYDAPIGMMVAIAFAVGVLVVGLVIYTATIERRREYGALKAIGARNRVLYRVVATQALVAAVAGAVVGVALGYGGGAALMAWRPQFYVEIEPAAVAAAVGSSLLMAVLASLIPARAIGRLAPAEVFRG